MELPDSPKLRLDTARTRRRGPARAGAAPDRQAARMSCRYRKAPRTRLRGETERARVAARPPAHDRESRLAPAPRTALPPGTEDVPAVPRHPRAVLRARRASRPHSRTALQARLS